MLGTTPRPPPRPPPDLPNPPPLLIPPASALLFLPVRAPALAIEGRPFVLLSTLLITPSLYRFPSPPPSP
eukprot:6456477-Pyramimonas_sp.AAC.1